MHRAGLAVIRAIAVVTCTGLMAAASYAEEGKLLERFPRLGKAECETRVDQNGKVTTTKREETCTREGDRIRCRVSEATGEHKQLSFYESRVDSAGIWTVGGGNESGGGYFEDPPTLSLPADVHDGKTWSAKYDAILKFKDGHTERRSATRECRAAASPRCAGGVLVIYETNTDGAGRNSSEMLYCPGRGRAEAVSRFYRPDGPLAQTSTMSCTAPISPERGSDSAADATAADADTHAQAT